MSILQFKESFLHGKADSPGLKKIAFLSFACFVLILLLLGNGYLFSSLHAIKREYENLRNDLITCDFKTDYCKIVGETIKVNKKNGGYCREFTVDKNFWLTSDEIEDCPYFLTGNYRQGIWEVTLKNNTKRSRIVCGMQEAIDYCNYFS